MALLRIAACCTLALASAGCILKAPPSADDLRRDALPHVAIPADWKAAHAAAQPVAGAWLLAFNDPLLTSLVDEALIYNADLAVAAARVEQASGYLAVASASLYPAVNVLAHGGGKSGGDGSGIQAIILNASLELDVWGRVRYGRAAAEGQSASAQADYAYARQSLAALVARSYFLAVQAGLQLAIAQDVLHSSEELLRLSGDRLRIGVGDEQTVVEARTALGSIRDTLRQLQYSRDQALRALELVLGRYPAAEISIEPHLAPMPGPVPAGLPSELLERRPDVIAAERRVAAAFNRVEEAKAAQLPRISLTASGSSISSDLFVLQDHSNPVWGLGGNLIAPLYQGGALRAQVDIRTAEQKQAVAEYTRAAQRAFSDVENALSAESALRDRDAILLENITNSQRALDLAQVQFNVGKIDMRTINQRQLAVYDTRMLSLQVQSDRLIQRVNLYLALGGSFGPDEHTAAAH